MKRPITTIRERLEIARNQKEFIKGLQIQGVGGSDLGNYHMTTSVICTFHGFYIEFRQNHWTLQNNGELFVQPFIKGLDGFAYERIEQMANEVVDYFKSEYFNQEMADAIIIEATKDEYSFSEN